MSQKRRPDDQARPRDAGVPGFGPPSGGGFGPPSGGPAYPPHFGTPGPAPAGVPSLGRPPAAAPPAAPGRFGDRPAPSGAPTSGFGDRLGGAPVPSDGAGPVRPPLVCLGLAGGLEVLALVLATLARGRPVLAVVAWLLAGFGAMSALVLFTVLDARRRTKPWYAPRPSAVLLRAALAVAAVLVVALASYQFSDWLARR